METTEKIIEAYVRYIMGWATIPNIKCKGQYEIDLLAIDPKTEEFRGRNTQLLGEEWNGQDRRGT